MTRPDDVTTLILSTQQPGKRAPQTPPNIRQPAISDVRGGHMSKFTRVNADISVIRDKWAASRNTRAVAAENTKHHKLAN